MKKESLLAIERIIACINELTILTKSKTEEYFYDSLEMNALINLIDEIELNIEKVDINIKNKYKDYNWDVIQKEQFEDEAFGMSYNLKRIWELSSSILKNELLGDLITLLEKEIPDYYYNLCHNNK